MARIRKCRQYGVPLGVSKDLVRHGNGVITRAGDPDHRMAIFSPGSIAAILEELRA